jgi:hypothetical protein
MSATERHADDLTRQERLRFLRHVYDNIDEQVRYSNYKASYVLATVGAVFVGCGAALLGPQIESLASKVLLVAGLVLSGVSGASAAMATFPVMKSKPGAKPLRSLMFFGSISAMAGKEYADTVSNLTQGEIIEELSQQIHALSMLCQEKYRWIRISTMALAVAMLLLFGAFTGIFLQ